MKISIITATRNNASHIEATIKSVIGQTYNNIEYIIIDGASTDESVQIIKKYAQQYSNFIKFISEPDTGVYNAINKGIKLATGDIIGILHGNDVFSSPTIIQQIVNEMRTSDAPFIYGDVKYISQNKRITRYYSSAQHSQKLLLQGIAPPHPSLYMRRELFEKYGLYKEDYLIGADFDMFLRLMIVNNIQGKYIPIDMVTMSIGGLSTRFYHRIFTNNIEKYRALKENSCNVSRFLLLKRYLCTIKSFKKARLSHLQNQN